MASAARASCRTVRIARSTATAARGMSAFMEDERNRQVDEKQCVLYRHSDDTHGFRPRGPPACGRPRRGSDHMNTTFTAPSENVRRDRAVGAVLVSAAGDALGAPHEFGQPLGADVALDMTGGGHLGWEPGEWTDDTQTAPAILKPLVDSVTPSQLIGEVEDGLLTWMRSTPRDVGGQTRAVLSEALHSGTPPVSYTHL